MKSYSISRFYATPQKVELWEWQNAILVDLPDDRYKTHYTESVIKKYIMRMIIHEV